MNWYLKVLKQYADFEGRARRMEYWMFTVINLGIYVVLYLLMFLMGGEKAILPMALIVIYSLAVFLPNLAVSVRRMHDVGKSGWMLLVAIVPILGAIYLLVLYFTDSEPGDNAYGPNPKEVDLV
ncbi:MAG: DUF805 domain-containing protein [Saprospiraceae bacterium]|jgi:uncharacterized membrane protein YhaH (DUF805 family)|nr:DUF805 domain-containing protein [Saprospiraceae bacterium]MBP9194344.1 DUF805 domain-containing protein [Saprospiraceae bacterium]